MAFHHAVLTSSAEPTGASCSAAVAPVRDPPLAAAEAGMPAAVAVGASHASGIATFGRW
jgi:hypothetical protein